MTADAYPLPPPLSYAVRFTARADAGGTSHERSSVGRRLRLDDRHDVGEFRTRVRERSGLGERVGDDELSVVFEVLSAAVSGGELADVRGRLPDDYAQYFPD